MNINRGECMMGASQQKIYVRAVLLAVLVGFFIIIPSVQASQENPTPADLAGAELLVPGETYTGGPFERGDGAFYKIPVPAGDQLQIFANIDGFALLRLFREDGDLLSDHQILSGQGSMFYLPGNTDTTNQYADHMVYVQMYAHSGRDLESFSFVVEIDANKKDIGNTVDAPDTFDHALSIAPGLYSNNFLAKNNCDQYCSTDVKDMYVLEVVDNEEVVVMVTPDSDLGISVAIYDALGQRTGFAEGSNAGAVASVRDYHEESGVVYIEVMGTENEYFGAYAMEVVTQIVEPQIVPGNNEDIGLKDNNGYADFDYGDAQEAQKDLEKQISRFEKVSRFSGIVFVSLGIIALLLTIFWVIMLIDAIRRRYADDNQKILWVAVIVVLGWVGAILYYFMVKRKGATHPTDYTQPPSDTPNSSPPIQPTDHSSE